MTARAGTITSGATATWLAVRQSSFSRYIAAVLFALLAVLLRLASDSYLTGAQFITFFPAVIVAAYLAGTGPGLATAALCGVAAWYFFIAPHYSFRIDELDQAVTLALYFAVSSLVALATGGMRAANHREQQARAALRASQDRMRRALDSISEGFVLLDREFRVLEINAAGLTLERRPLSEIIGRTHWEVWPGSEHSELGRLYKHAMSSGEPVSLEHHYTWDGGREAWLDMHAYPTEVGLTIFYRDITEHHLAEARQRESEARLRSILEQLPVGVIIARVPSGELILYNRSSEQIMGHPMLGGTASDYGTYGALHLDGTPYAAEEYPMARAVLRGERIEDEELRYRRPDGTIVHLSVSATRIVEPAGGSQLAVCTFDDITERKRHEEHQRLLINELNHRAKNLLAVISGIAQQTFKDSSIPAGVRHAFTGRLGALAASHDLLTQRSWESVPIRDLILNTVTAVWPDINRVDVSGPKIALAPQTGVSLGMAMHELTTNAMKYGALSTLSGRVSITWQLDGSHFRLTWRESGGPPVSAPGQSGFGSKMIERSLAAELGGTARLSFEPEGVVWTIEASLPSIEAEVDPSGPA